MKDKALRLALEVLEEMSHVNTYQNEDDEVGMKFCCDQVSYQPHSTDCQTMKAITAIKQALEQPAPEPVAVWELQETGWETICDADWLMTLPMGTRLYTSPPNRGPEPEPVACPYCKNSATLGAVYYDQNCVGCVKRMAPPPKREPEPVVWTAMAFARLGMVRDKMHPDDVATVQRFLDGDYTSPPKRKPLTDEQISRIWGSYFSRAFEFARAIEAAHGIGKNHD